MRNKHSSTAFPQDYAQYSDQIARRAEEVARRVPEEQRQQVRVLEVGAGTGLIGAELYKKGFR